MADVAVGFLQQSIEQILSDKDVQVVDIKVQIDKLRKDLIRFKAFLRDNSEQSRNNEGIRAIVNNITSVVYKAEDTIDKYVVEKAIFKERNKVGRIIHSPDYSSAVRKVVKDISYLILTEIQQIHDQNLLDTLPVNVPTERKPPRAVEEDNVVGFDEVAGALIKRLTKVENPDLDIITVVGMPGLGKTTLVRKIYNDPAIEYEFFMRAWVYVSQKYTKKEVYISILNIIKEDKDYSKKPEETIAKELRELLEKGKYLIVMDDVWSASDWEDLKNAFPNNKYGSRILITSRNEQVAKQANPINGTHALKFLTAPESWELLENKVFGKEECPPGELKILGEHIAAKCEGLPLAIVVIAGILLNNSDSKDWWQQVADNVKQFVIDDEDQFNEVFAMSYIHLPYHLKSCFLYLGVFPEDYEIPVWNLIHLWIAEGFIEPNGNQSLEDIAEVCVTDLVNRSLLMASERRSNGQIKTCQVHDMLYDFCRKEAGKQNFYQEIKSSNFNDKDPENYRRLCIHSRVMNYINSKPQGPSVRSFICLPADGILMPQKHAPTIPKAFTLLRVLDIKSIVFGIFPKDLLQLALLRYLALNCNIKALPSNISRLWYMQTLILLTTSPTLEFKDASIWKLYQLRHLRTNASAQLPCPPSEAPKGREDVQSLSMISPESCKGDILERTPNIKKLGVKGTLTELFDKLFDNVGNLQYLTNLKLYNDRATSEGIVLRLPPTNKFPHMLKKLTLANMLLDSEQMEILENLKKLEVLKLKTISFKGEIWTLKDKGFVSLLLLHIERTNLVTWKASDDHFKSLKRLVLRHCESLVAVPYVFGEISTFQALELYRTSLKAAASARKIQGKKNIEAIKGNNIAAFKLSIYPPDME